MRTRKKIFIAILGAEGVMIAVFIVLICYFSSDAVKMNRRMESAQRYLLDEDYERAIAAFDRIIEMDSDNADAYIGMAEAYAETGALDQTVAILERGAQWVKKSDSYEIQAMLDRYMEELEQLRASQETDSEMAEASQQQEPAEPTADPGVQPEEAAAVNTGFITQDGELYYYDALGSLVVGWFEVDGSRYYAGADGRIYRNGEYEVDSVKYRFGQEGICVEEVKDEAWKQAYIDYVIQEHQDYLELLEDYPQMDSDLSSYDFVYINDDDTPELVGFYPNPGVFSGSTTLLYYSDEMVKSDDLIGGFSYMERKNVIRMWYHDYRMNDNYENLYSENEVFIKIIKDEIVEVAEASIRWRDNGNNPNDCIYFWDDIEISEDDFRERYQEMSYNEEEASSASGSYTYEQILDVIRKY